MKVKKVNIAVNGLTKNTILQTYYSKEIAKIKALVGLMRLKATGDI